MSFRMNANGWWLILSLLVVGFDQLSKQWVLHHVQLGEVIPVMPYFNITLSFNAGAAFSFLANQGGWQQWLFALIAVVVVMGLTRWLWTLPSKSHLAASSLALIIGGALGNLWDRLHDGYVIDFLDFYFGTWHFATFNVADSAISVGASVLIFAFFQNAQEQTES